MAQDLIYPADLLGKGNDYSNIFKISLIGVEPASITQSGGSIHDLSKSNVGDKKGSSGGSSLTAVPGLKETRTNQTVITTGKNSRNTHTSIWLPAPQVFNFTQVSNWGGGNLGGFNNLSNRKFMDIVRDAWKHRFANDGVDMLGELSALAQDIFAPAVNSASSLGSEELGNAIEYRTRSVRNPHAKVLFQGPNFRQFQFAFSMVPFEEKDSVAIKEIIRAFSKASAPGYANRYNGYLGSDNWFSYPDEVEIEVMIKDPETGEILPNPFVQAFRRCVATDVTTAYGGQTVFSTHRSGAPMDLQLSVSFMETEYLTKDRAEILYQGEKPPSDTTGNNN